MRVGTARSVLVDRPAVPSPRPVLAATRTWFFVDVFVLAAAGVQCFILASDTDRWFAWTVAPPLSAAVLGAGYFGSIAMVVLSRRARRWVDARIVLISTFVFATLTLAVTLRHLDRFHLDHGDAPARLAGVAWVIVYAVVPPVTLWLLVVQHRVPGIDPPRDGPVVPAAVRAAFVVEAVALVGLGVLLVIRGAQATFWPWQLSDLTAEAIAAWVLALGVMLVLCAREGEVSRVRPALSSVATAASLWVVALVRFRDTVDWQPGGAVAVGSAVLVVVSALAGIVDRRPPRPGHH